MTHARPRPAVERGIATGDLYGDVAAGGHHCRMYRWSESRRLPSRYPCAVAAAPASNHSILSVTDGAALQGVVDDEALWPAFLHCEEDLCREQGALDGGTRIIAVVRKDGSGSLGMWPTGYCRRDRLCERPGPRVSQLPFAVLYGPDRG